MAGKTNKRTFTMPKRKLTSRDIMGDDMRVLWRRWKKEDPNLMEKEVYKITGMASFHDTKPSPYGDTERLVGDFIAVNNLTGEVFRSNRCYLPSIMQDAVVAALTSSAKGEGVQFAFQIIVVDDSENVKNLTGFVYAFKPLMEVKESDQMQKLANAIGVPLLPAEEQKQLV